MTRLFNDPATFAEDMLAGFLDANSGYVAGVPGGVVRARETPPGKVAVVVGGGSGHYPAFCGVVGRGFADGAVVGNVFTSPSAQEAYTVAKAAAGDAGVLILSGNYAGDVLNFTSAAQRLTAEGTAARVLFVTDDLASAPPPSSTAAAGSPGTSWCSAWRAPRPRPVTTSTRSRKWHAAPTTAPAPSAWLSPAEPSTRTKEQVG